MPARHRAGPGRAGPGRAGPLAIYSFTHLLPTPCQVIKARYGSQLLTVSKEFKLQYQLIVQVLYITRQLA